MSLPVKTIPKKWWLTGGLLLAVVIGLAGVFLLRSPVDPDRVLAAYSDAQAYGGLTVLYPQDETLFPPEIVPPTFRWRDEQRQADAWLVLFTFPDQGRRLRYICSQPSWMPLPADWEEIKRRSRQKETRVAIIGFNHAAPQMILSGARLRLMTSADEVGAPIFYREVNLPFIEAVKDPTRIHWRFGSIASPQPPRVVLDKLPVCGNCHSFSKDGQTLGMDVDYANDKGSYVITRVAKEMSLATSDIITWSDYRREDQQQTFGFLSQVSPDGERVVSTVKDKSVFVALPPLAFSQLFFPIKGILAIYDRRTQTYQALPGADDPAYVQSNPAWSPDGKYIVFARAKAYQLRNASSEGKVLLTPEECAEFSKEGKPFVFDLYRIPYNQGRGGTPEPLRGASHNGKSNFFAKYSPDGKWIIFCQAKSYMLLQPDSELYLIPADGGEARRLRGNTTRMNSWHSWSPNGRWLVFSSKANTDYTQLFLTHIDDQGNSSPPVVLDHFTAPDRAANIPEFVNAPPAAVVKIHENFLNDVSLIRAAYVLEKSGEVDAAIDKYQQALAINPKNVHAHQRLGFLLFNVKKKFEDGLAHTLEALRLDPADGCAQFNLGMALMYLGKLDEAIAHLTEALRIMPNGFGNDYTPAKMNLSLGTAYLYKEAYAEATAPLTQAAQLAPGNASAHYQLAIALAAQGQLDEPLSHYTQAMSLDAKVDVSPEFHDMLGINYAGLGRFAEASKSAERALALAQATKKSALAEDIAQRLAAYQQHLR